MEIRIASWNIAGAKLFGRLNPAPDNVAKDYISEYKRLWETDIHKYITGGGGDSNLPEIIFLQECIGFRDTREQPSRRWESGKQILSKIFQNYECFFFPSLSSYHNPHPRKWEKYRRTDTYLPDFIEAQQGYGICIKKPDRLRSLWVNKMEDNSDRSKVDKVGQANYNLCFQSINISTGLYLGSRDTEPRLAILGRMKLKENKYVNFINLHLTTLKAEREGKLRINREASSIRLSQLNLILDYVVAAYQESNLFRIQSNLRNEDIWIIGGDFNATPESEEITLLKKLGFVDGNANKVLKAPNSSYNNKTGTKWSLRNENLPPIVVDYIFCGIEKSSFPSGKIDVRNSLQPFRPNFKNSDFESDHAFLFSSFQFDV